MLQEHRQYQRLIPVRLPGRIQEWGPLRLFGRWCRCRRPPTQDRDTIISVAFEVPECNSHVRASAEVVWTNDLRRRTGLRFVDLAETSLQVLSMTRSLCFAVPALLSFATLSVLTSQIAIFLIYELPGRTSPDCRTLPQHRLTEVPAQHGVGRNIRDRSTPRARTKVEPKI